MIKVKDPNQLFEYNSELIPVVDFKLESGMENGPFVDNCQCHIVNYSKNAFAQIGKDDASRLLGFYEHFKGQDIHKRKIHRTRANRMIPKE